VLKFQFIAMVLLWTPSGPEGSSGNQLASCASGPWNGANCSVRIDCKR